MSEEIMLLPCPFCGGEACFETNEDTEGDVYFVGCSKYCRMMPDLRVFEDEDQAVKMWNHRTPGPRDIFTVEFDSSKLTEEQRKAFLMSGPGQIEVVPIIDPVESVIRWVRYDGTPETLPGTERVILLNHPDLNGIQAAYVGGDYCLEVFGVDGKEAGVLVVRDGMNPCGYEWAYLPESPEEMGQ